MEHSECVLFSFYRFSGWKQKFWAFKQMGLGYRELVNEPHLSFLKMLGTGSGNGLNWYPDFSRYGILTVWESPEKAADFLSAHPLMAEYKKRSESCQSYLLQTFQAKGEWDGKNPFKVEGLKGASTLNASQQVAILTRASIRPSKTLSFWRNVPKVSNRIQFQPGCKFSVGIGEVPIFQQATFSVWESLEQVKNFAYREKEHAEVVKKTRQLNWYSEELFARFVLLEQIS